MYIGDSVVTVDGHNGVITGIDYCDLDGNGNQNNFVVTLDDRGSDEVYSESELFLF